MVPRRFAYHRRAGCSCVFAASLFAGSATRARYTAAAHSGQTDQSNELPSIRANPHSSRPRAAETSRIARFAIRRRNRQLPNQVARCAWRPRSTGSTSTRVRLRSGSSRTQLSASAIRAQTSTLPQRGKSLRSTVDGPLRPATDRDENQLGAYRGAWTPTACAGSACESPSPMSSAKSAFLVGLMGLIDGAGVTVL